MSDKYKKKKNNNDLFWIFLLFLFVLCNKERIKEDKYKNLLVGRWKLYLLKGDGCFRRDIKALKIGKFNMILEFYGSGRIKLSARIYERAIEDEGTFKVKGSNIVMKYSKKSEKVVPFSLLENGRLLKLISKSKDRKNCIGYFRKL